MGRPRSPSVVRTWTVTIHHAGVNPNTDEEETIRSREQVRAETDTEAVVVALVRTAVDRASMGTRVVQIEVG